MTFIYTRCPYPEYCPLVSKNFAQVYAATRASAPAGFKGASAERELRSAARHAGGAEALCGNISPDRRGPVFDRWEFVAAPPNELKDVADFFGLYFSGTGDQIVHSMSTTVISPDGTVSKVVSG